MVSQSSAVPQGRPHPRDTKPGGRPNVEGGTLSQRVEIESHYRSEAVEQVRGSGGGPVRLTRKHTLWFSLSSRDNPPLGADAFSHHPWPRTLLYAFPPVPLIPRLLERTQEEGLSVILVAPERTNASWFPTLVQLLAAPPWQLPWQEDALSQLDGAIAHPPVITQRLWGWLLSGNACRG